MSKASARERAPELGAVICNPPSSGAAPSPSVRRAGGCVLSPPMRRRDLGNTTRPASRWPIGSAERATCERQAAALTAFEMAQSAYAKGAWLEARYWRGTAWREYHKARVLAGVEEPDEHVLGAGDAAELAERVSRRKR